MDKFTTKFGKNCDEVAPFSKKLCRSSDIDFATNFWHKKIVDETSSVYITILTKFGSALTWVTIDARTHFFGERLDTSSSMMNLIHGVIVKTWGLSMVTKAATWNKMYDVAIPIEFIFMWLNNNINADNHLFLYVCQMCLSI